MGTWPSKQWANQWLQFLTWSRYHIVIFATSVPWFQNMRNWRQKYAKMTSLRGNRSVTPTGEMSRVSKSVRYLSDVNLDQSLKFCLCFLFLEESAAIFVPINYQKFPRSQRPNKASWWFQPIWTNISQIGSFSQVWLKIVKCLSCHHPESG